MAARWIFGLVCFATLTGTAMADSQTFDLIGSNGNPPCSAGAPCAQITINTNGNMANFTVSSLVNGWIFDRFGFNTVSGVPALMFGGAGGEIGPTAGLNGPGGPAPNCTGCFAENGWGKFMYQFDTGKNGGANGTDCVVTAGKPGPGCTFIFSVTSTTALTVADFKIASSGGSGSGLFAGHQAASNNSGYSGNSQPILPPLSEPATLAVVVPGLLVAFGQLRRRVLLV